MAQKKRGKSRRAQRPRPPVSRPGVAGASANGREESRPELNGDVADPLADAEARLDEREAALERERSAQPDAETEAEALPAAGDDADQEELEEAPGALEHAAPDVEIAEAQIALGAFEASELESDGDELDGGGSGRDAPEWDEPGAGESVRDEPEAGEPVRDEPEVGESVHDEPEGDETGAQDEPLLTSDPVFGARPAPRARRRPLREPSDAEDEADARTPAAASGAPRLNPIVRLVHFVQGSWRELQRVQWPDRRQVMQATGVVIGFVIVAGVFLGVSDWLAGKLVNWILG